MAYPTSMVDHLIGIEDLLPKHLKALETGMMMRLQIKDLCLLQRRQKLLTGRP
ncbi:Hypothetical protein P9303_18081 [Prochlorococcus marinus str. MIT 9303]|uniref:Uncharacterized protein n=1 Tax=Prochlorococcus marinus (strain MIT 9303) TaxID=59922 RepID=A2CAP0_PROM3|nr:Hypothetical protein P9303_18081 [Prochlorococcus marinus str. MIT 9303]